MSAARLVRSRLPFLGLLVLGTLSAPAFAGAPELVEDLNPVQAYREGPQPQDFQAFGGQAVCIASETQRGRTLWASDGTPAGTRRLAEGLDAVTAIVGEASGGLMVIAARDFQHQPGLWRVDLQGRAERLVPEGVAVFGRQFVAFDGSHFFFATPAPGLAKSYSSPVPTSLWRTDGTSAGTREVAPLGASDFTVGPLVFRGRLVFLVALRGEDEPETYLTLWASDGRSAAGTVELADLDSASLELFLVPTSRRLLFPARARRGEELWGTDGTVAGTYALTDFPAERPFSSGYVRPTPAAGRLYFLADDGEHGRELWASDGTGRGTLRLTDFPGDDPFTIDEHGSAAMDAAGPGALFAADDGTHGLELWRTDGSPGSTALVADLCSGSCSGFVQPGLARNGRLLFTGRTPETGIEPWASDGTAEGTALLADLSAGDASFRFVNLGGEAAFVDQSEDFRFALYATDGTTGGTELLLEADLGLSIPTPEPFVKLGRKLLFFGGDGRGTAELWVARVPRGGVMPVTDITQDQPGGSDPVDLTAADGKVFFVGCAASGNAALYATAGSGASTLLDLGNSCANFFHPLTDDRLLSEVGGRAFFAYLDLWVSDGTAEGTVNLTRFEYIPTAFPIVVSNVADLGGLAAFAVLESVDPGGGYRERLWLSDGTPEGTLPTDALPQPLRVFELFSLRGRLYFWGWDAQGPGFWSSDGTAAGTHLLYRLPEFVSPPDEPPVEALGAVYFLTAQPQYSLGLWRTDGTPEGTEEVALRPQLLFGVPASDLAATSGGLFFVAAVGQGGERELWHTDGTPAGTTSLGSLGLTLFDDIVPPLVVADRLFLLTTSFAESRLWVSDGTSSGTRPVASPLGQIFSYQASLEAVGGRVFFAVVDPERGWELWESDGTDSGTHLAADLAPGAASAEPRELTALGSDLYFSADDGTFGREPWRLPATPGCEPSPFALCLAGDRVQATLAWRDAAGIPRRAAARALAADSGGFSFLDPARLEVVAKALDATAVNRHLWAFAGSLSDASWELTLRDGVTGGALRWVNLLRQQTARVDHRAFPAAGPPAAEEAVRVLEESGPALAGRRALELAPALSPAPPCQPAPGVLCLHGGRFRVEVGREGGPLSATVLPWSDLAGAFALAPGANADLAIKVLDGSGVNGRFWVFGTALTHRAYTVTVTDTVTGTRRSYAKPEGALEGFADLGSF